MAVQTVVFRRDPAEEIVQIGDHVRIGVLLNRQRRRRVLDEKRQQAGRDARMWRATAPLLLREIVKPFAASGDVKLRGALNHSTVTLLARLRG